MLTDAQCRNAVCPSDKKQARFSDSGGMYLQVSPAGSKRWFLKYRIAGAEKQLALGSYPSVSLTAARKARDAAKLQKSQGADPLMARKIEKLKASRPGGDTFKAVVMEWYAKQAPQWSDSHAERSLRQLERDLFPWIGDRPMIDIHPMELLSALQKIEERGAIETADRVLMLARQVWDYWLPTPRSATQHHRRAERPVNALSGQELCSHPRSAAHGRFDAGHQRLQGRADCAHGLAANPFALPTTR